MGTDDYEINQANSSSTSSGGWTTDNSYSLNLTDTISSSWNDIGYADMTDGYSLTDQGNTYTWHDLSSVTDSVTDLQSVTNGLSGTYSVDQLDAETAGGMESVSLADSGSETFERR